MRLRKFRVQAFRCIHDSGDVIVGDLAAFVGRNESGKTTILQALTMLNKDEYVSELDLCDEMTERLKDKLVADLGTGPGGAGELVYKLPNVWRVNQQNLPDGKELLRPVGR